MVEQNYVPEKGDFVMVNLNPTSGHEQAGHRPAVVLTPQSYNSRTGLCLICPVTNSIKDYPFEVECNSPDVTGVVISDQVRSIDWRSRNFYYKSKISADVLEEVIGKLSSLFEL